MANINFRDYEDDDEDIQVVRKFETLEQRKQDHSPIIKMIKKKPMSPQQELHKQIRQSFKQQKFKEVLELARKDPKLIQKYDQIKYHDEYYGIQQDVFIKNANNPDEDYVGKILNIYQVLESKTRTYILLIEIQWCYRRSEIIKIQPQHKSWISRHEVFSTSNTDIIQSTAINGPCRILSLEEFEDLEDIDSTTFFSRCSWSDQKQKLVGFDNIKKQCICKQPINPDLSYIQCDKCGEWYHMSCVGVRDGEYGDDQDYFCRLCKRY